MTRAQAHQVSLRAVHFRQLPGPLFVCRLQALALLALSLLVAETSAIRLFDHKHPLKREIGRPRQGGDGKFVSSQRCAANKLARGA